MGVQSLSLKARDSLCSSTRTRHHPDVLRVRKGDLACTHSRRSQKPCAGVLRGYIYDSQAKAYKKQGEQSSPFFKAGLLRGRSIIGYKFHTTSKRTIHAHSQITK